jgi:hypothetical protein
VSTVDPDDLARLVRALHGYALDAAAARRCAEIASALAAAVAVHSLFHEEPAGFARTLSALAPTHS